MKLIHRGILGVLVSIGAFSQTAPPRPEFEVASIRPSGPMRPAQLDIGLHLDGAQITSTYLSLKDYLGMAYRLKLHQISGPDWMATERFDIAAKLPSGAKRDQIPVMLQALIDDRFQMKSHREMKEFPVYALIVGKGGLKIRESPLDVDPAESGPSGTPGGSGAINVTASGGRGGTTVNYGRGSSFTFGENKLEAKKLPMLVFADALGRFLDRPVVDMTDLQGNYDFTLEFSPEDFRAMQIRAALAAGVVLPPEALRLIEMGNGDSLFSAVQAVGLKLESRKAPVEVLVIDHLEKTPTAN